MMDKVEGIVVSEIDYRDTSKIINFTGTCSYVCEDTTLDNFKIILDKLAGYTEYLYLHVLGEPLLHPDINKLIDEASKRYKINITTNGYLINRIKY